MSMPRNHPMKKLRMLHCS